MRVVAAEPPALSAEVFVIPLDDGNFVVYAPLRQAAFVANATMVNLLADLRRGTLEPSADPDGAIVEFLTRLELVNAGEERRPVTSFVGDPEPTQVTLYLTTACNLRCTYCYASAGDTPVRTMPVDVAKRGIDFIIRNALKKGAKAVEVSYHGGGEPTVNWNVLTMSHAYGRRQAEAAGLEMFSTSATNGVLTDEQIDWTIANLNGVSLSFDGLPSVHDAHRVTPIGRGSSDRVIHTLRRFDRAGFGYGVRVTVTAEHIPTLAESIDFICSQFRPARIQVEPAYQLGRWQQAPSAETQAFINAYREAQQAAARHGQEISYSAARLGLLTNHFCGITQDNFCLSPDGNVSACFEVFSEDNRWSGTFFYGRPDPAGDGYVFDFDVLNNLRRQTVENRSFCDGCFARWSCAGDCHHKALNVSGGREFVGSERCHITRELTKDQVLARIAKAGGAFWHEPQTATSCEAPAGKEMLL